MPRPVWRSLTSFAQGESGIICTAQEGDWQVALIVQLQISLPKVLHSKWIFQM